MPIIIRLIFGRDYKNTTTVFKGGFIHIKGDGNMEESVDVTAGFDLVILMLRLVLILRMVLMVRMFFLEW